MLIRNAALEGPRSAKSPNINDGKKKVGNGYGEPRRDADAGTAESDEEFRDGFMDSFRGKERLVPRYFGESATRLIRDFPLANMPSLGAHTDSTLFTIARPKRNSSDRLSVSIYRSDILLQKNHSSSG